MNYLLLAVLSAAALSAEQGVLAVHVSDAQNRPMERVTLATQGDGSTAPPTDRSGKTRLRLAPATRPGQWVSLQIVRGPKDLSFISPWDGRARVPPFENESENFVPVVLAERGDRAVLELGNAVASLAAKINAASAPQPAAPPAADRRKAALESVAEAFGLDVASVDKALRELWDKSKDPYERGMSALYAQNYAGARDQLGKALQNRQTKLKPNIPGVVNAALFLGDTLVEEGKFGQAAQAYRTAAAEKPDESIRQRVTMAENMARRRPE